MDDVNFNNRKMRFYIVAALYSIVLLVESCSTHSKVGGPVADNAAIYSTENTNDHKLTVRTKAEWNQKRSRILENMQMVMGILPDRRNLPGFDLRYTDSIEFNTYTRYSINFKVADSERITAYLYIPAESHHIKQVPAMVALHETDPLGKGSVDGQGVNSNLAYAKELAQRGYIVIAPDYPGFGEMKEYDFDKDRYLSGTMKGIFDHMRCVDLLQSLEIVDPERIGVIGHSLGGHNSIFVGAFDTRLKIVVSSCGWTGFNYYDVGEIAVKMYGGRLGPWAQPRYMPLLREKYNLDSKKIPFDFDEVIAAIAPRVFFSNSPLYDENFAVKGVSKGIENASVIYRLLNVPGNLQVNYPGAKHDFPPDIRMKAYNLIDKVFQYKPDVMVVNN